MRILRILEGMTIDNDDIIIDNDFNSFINGLDNKSLENKKWKKNTNIAIIIQEPDFDELCNLCIRTKNTQIINHKPMTPITKKLKAVYGDL